MTGYEKRNIIAMIEDDIVRGEIVDGVYSIAEFQIGNNSFCVKADEYDANGVRVGSLITRNGIPYRGGLTTNGAYYNLSFKGVHVLEHRVLALALIPDAARLMLEEDMVVNHMIIYSDAERRRREIDEQYARDFAEWCTSFNGDAPHISGCKIDLAPPCDVRILELCTASENTKHASLVRGLGLYDRRISAHDADALSKILINDRYVQTVLDHYENYGIESTVMDFT